MRHILRCLYCYTEGVGCSFLSAIKSIFARKRVCEVWGWIARMSLNIYGEVSQAKNKVW